MAGHFHLNTPLLESAAMSKLVGTTVYLKMENSQPSGSFKIRGIGHLCQQVGAQLSQLDTTAAHGTLMLICVSSAPLCSRPANPKESSAPQVTFQQQCNIFTRVLGLYLTCFSFFSYPEGGNAGMAAAYVARKMGVPATVVIPSSTPQLVVQKLQDQGATVKIIGKVMSF